MVVARTHRHMTTTENADSDNQVQIEAWLAGLKLNPQLGEDTLKILEAWKKRFWKRRPKDTHSSDYRELLAASLYAAIKADPMCSGIALHDFLIVTKAQKKSVLRHYRKIVLDMGITPQACSIKPGPYLDALLVKVGADEKLKARATAILTEYVKTGGSANSPTAIAAASFYAACLERRYEPLPKDQTVDELLREYNSIVWAPQDTIAGLVGINSATLLNYFRRIKGASPSHVGRELHNKLLENYATNHPREAHIRPNPLNVDKLFKV